MRFASGLLTSALSLKADIRRVRAYLSLGLLIHQKACGYRRMWAENRCELR